MQSEKEKRRLKAGRLFEEGYAQSEVRRRLGVSRQSVSRWWRVWEKAGVEGLKSQRRVGRPSGLGRVEVKAVVKVLKKGADKQGWSNGLWTLPRVAKVIEKLTGKRYHPAHVWKLLGQWGFSCQRPAKRAYQQNKKEVKHWKEVQWPAIKKKPGKKDAPSCSSTKAA